MFDTNRARFPPGHTVNCRDTFRAGGLGLPLIAITLPVMGKRQR
jgi:hypothetical protein